MIKKIVLLSLLFSATALANNKTHAEGKKMNILENQPVFTLQVDSYAIKHDININGVSILRDYDEDGQSSTNFPINHLIRSGKNKIELGILPAKPKEEINQNSSISIQLNVHAKNNPDIKHTLSTIIFKGGLENYIGSSSLSGKYNINQKLTTADDGIITVEDIITEKIHDYEGALKFSRYIQIPAPFPLWGFFESDELPDYDSMTDDEYYNEIQNLLDEYLIIQTAISNKNFDALSNLVSERNHELDTAFYAPTGTAHNNLISSLKDASEDNTLELVGLKKTYVNIIVEENNKIAGLYRENNTPAIALRFKSGNGTQSYDFKFRRKNKKWILTR